MQVDVITHRLYFVCIEKFMYSSAPSEDYSFLLIVLLVLQP